jgi:hypothetical protein
MIPTDFDTMNLDELRQYMLTHREDINAFHAYVDRSKASGRMITINPNDPNWEDALEQKIQQVISDKVDSN